MPKGEAGSGGPPGFRAGSPTEAWPSPQTIDDNGASRYAIDKRYGWPHSVRSKTDVLYRELCLGQGPFSQLGSSAKDMPSRKRTQYQYQGRSTMKFKILTALFSFALLAAAPEFAHAQNYPSR